VAALAQEVADEGPLTAAELRDPARKPRRTTPHGDWFRSSEGKNVLEGLFDAGTIASAGRPNFERVYDLAERVIPEGVRRAPALDTVDAQRVLVRRAMTALGVAAVREVADYFRLPIAATRARLRELVDAGELESANVQGWSGRAFLVPGGDDRPVAGCALLSPFDSLIWDRDRTTRLFGFEHSFEIYVKPDQRKYGYYVLPFLHGEQLVARLDLKADRPRAKLSVLAAHLEPGVVDDTVVDALAGEVRRLAGWLALPAIEVADRDSLAPALAKALA